jgi:glycosyltransferase involved in cell wall biosynthesis
MAASVDVVHTWPLGARATLTVARTLGIPTVLERPNAHTRYAFSVVRAECERLNVRLPPDHEHAFNERVLEIEEQEYQLADYLLCPSDFVVRTFRDAGHDSTKLVRHFYGYDETKFTPAESPASGDGTPLTLAFVGVAAVRKGLHFALDAWLQSRASATGTFLIVGSILPEYERALRPFLAHPSVKILGHRTDVPDLMRRSDALVLPSIEEGSALVCGEAIGSGCVPLVSDATSGVCQHDVNSLIHHVGHVEELSRHMTAIHEDRLLLKRLRERALADAPAITWRAAGRHLGAIYEDVARAHPESARPAGVAPRLTGSLDLT